MRAQKLTSPCITTKPEETTTFDVWHTRTIHGAQGRCGKAVLGTTAAGSEMPTGVPSWNDGRGSYRGLYSEWSKRRHMTERRRSNITGRILVREDSRLCSIRKPL